MLSVLQKTFYGNIRSNKYQHSFFDIYHTSGNTGMGIFEQNISR